MKKFVLLILLALVPLGAPKLPAAISAYTFGNYYNEIAFLSFAILTIRLKLIKLN